MNNLNLNRKSGMYINLFFLPLFIGGLFFLSRIENLKYLLLPPIGAITFLLFQDPLGPKANIEHLIILPVYSSVVGILTNHTLGANVFSIILTSFIIVLTMYYFKVFTPPGLALNLLALLLNISSWTYPASVLISTTILFFFLQLWKIIFNKPSNSEHIKSVENK